MLVLRGDTNEQSASDSDTGGAASFYFTDDAMYRVNEKQFDELMEKHNIDEVIVRDGLTPLPQKKSVSSAREKKVRVSPMMRTPGSWNIDYNDIDPGYVVTYSMPDGDSFAVDAGERLVCEISPSEPCQLVVGATGSRSFEANEYIDMDSVRYIRLGTEHEGNKVADNFERIGLVADQSNALTWLLRRAVLP